MFCVIIALRHVVEMAVIAPVNEFVGGIGLAPSAAPSFASIISLHDLSSLLETVAGPLLLIYASEVSVDWLKHSFITKFNGIPPDVYRSFLDSLSRDFCKWYRPELKNLQSIPLRMSTVAIKIGFSPLPITCLLLRVVVHALQATQIQLTPIDLFYYVGAVYSM